MGEGRWTGGMRRAPLLQTRRGRLQKQRSALNAEMSRELRLKAGAENLLAVSHKPESRAALALELSFLNSNIDLLRHKLGQLNNSLHEYQPPSPDLLPLIPVPLKETWSADFSQPLRDLMLEHFSAGAAELAGGLEGSLETLSELREEARRPERSLAGAETLRMYCAQLGLLVRRFFPAQRSPLQLSWFDAVSGTCEASTDLRLERAAFLFNLGALYSQVGAKEERMSPSGVDNALHCLQMAAGCFQHLETQLLPLESQSEDLKGAPHLAQLLLSQAMEVRLEQRLRQRCLAAHDLHSAFSVSSQAATLSQSYTLVGQALQSHFPGTWTSLVLLKSHHYLAVAHFWAARGILATSVLDSRTRQVYSEHFAPWGWDELGSGVEERTVKAVRHLNRALALHEDAEAEWDLCLDLHAGLAAVAIRLTDARAATAELRELLLPSDALFPTLLPGDIQLLPPTIRPNHSFEEEVAPTEPDLTLSREQDLFSALGPVEWFTVERSWGAPRRVEMRRGPGTAGFGFTIRGDAPVRIGNVEAGSLAEASGLRNGDLIVGLGGEEAKWATHEEAVHSLVAMGETMVLEVVSPSGAQAASDDRDLLCPKAPKSRPPQTSLPIKFRAAYLWRGGEDNKGFKSAKALVRRLSRSDAFLSLRARYNPSLSTHTPQ